MSIIKKIKEKLINNLMTIFAYTVCILYVLDLFFPVVTIIKRIYMFLVKEQELICVIFAAIVTAAGIMSLAILGALYDYDKEERLNKYKKLYNIKY